MELGPIPRRPACVPQIHRDPKRATTRTGVRHGPTAAAASGLSGDATTSLTLGECTFARRLVRAPDITGASWAYLIPRWHLAFKGWLGFGFCATGDDGSGTCATSLRLAPLRPTRNRVNGHLPGQTNMTTSGQHYPAVSRETFLVTGRATFAWADAALGRKVRITARQPASRRRAVLARPRVTPTILLAKQSWTMG